MPVIKRLPEITGDYVDAGALYLEKFIGAESYAKLYKAVETGEVDPDSEPSSRRSSWSSAASSSFSSSSVVNKVWAVKILRKPKSYEEDPAIYEREFAMHSRVSSHPNVVSLHGHFVERGYFFLVMDFQAMGTLVHAIRSGVYQRNSALIKRTFGQLTDAVLFCHKQGVYHRNIKPSHVLVDYWGCNPCLTDFGLATTEDINEQLGFGTAAYMTPESFDLGAGPGSYSAARSDYWAMGVTLFNMITRQAVWYSARPVEDVRYGIFLRHRKRYLRDRFPISFPFARLCSRFFTLEPAERPSLLEFNEQVQKMDDVYIDEIDVHTAALVVRKQVWWRGPGRIEGLPPYPAPPEVWMEQLPPGVPQCILDKHKYRPAFQRSGPLKPRRSDIPIYTYPHVPSDFDSALPFPTAPDLDVYFAGSDSSLSSSDDSEWHSSSSQSHDAAYRTSHPADDPSIMGAAPAFAANGATCGSFTPPPDVKESKVKRAMRELRILWRRRCNELGWTY
ncbi:kinase-like domain-containing protein [Roridomyces roridus]|uniref:non-specific serine/threonine protein kinase n=1 Tax=Roridomyces roridus TaxID=1738132 RepID=A0AAD7FR21_9AGAR|nr:kinase-like domain-containing protein [Roridomyces roridus]